MTTRQINAAIMDAERNGMNFYMRDPKTGEGRRIIRAIRSKGKLCVLELASGLWLNANDDSEFYER